MKKINIIIIIGALLLQGAGVSCAQKSGYASSKQWISKTFLFAKEGIDGKAVCKSFVPAAVLATAASYIKPAETMTLKRRSWQGLCLVSAVALVARDYFKIQGGLSASLDSEGLFSAPAALASVWMAWKLNAVKPAGQKQSEEEPIAKSFVSNDAPGKGLIAKRASKKRTGGDPHREQAVAGGTILGVSGEQRSQQVPAVSQTSSGSSAGGNSVDKDHTENTGSGAPGSTEMPSSYRKCIDDLQRLKIQLVTAEGEADEASTKAGALGVKLQTDGSVKRKYDIAAKNAEDKWDEVRKIRSDIATIEDHLRTLHQAAAEQYQNRGEPRRSGPFNRNLQQEELGKNVARAAAEKQAAKEEKKTSTIQSQKSPSEVGNQVSGLVASETKANKGSAVSSKKSEGRVAGLCAAWEARTSSSFQ